VKYLITGKNGQLAVGFAKEFEKRTIDYLALDRQQLDITDLKNIDDVLGSYRPNVVINCAAYNYVDRAEEEKEKAFAVNSTGTKLLAENCLKYNIFLIHFSSDYVFDGSKENGLITEEDPPNPLNIYGKSKLDGERFIQKELNQFLIFRVSWLYGEGKQNFIYKILEWFKNREYLKISCDEYSVPTNVQSVVDVTMKSLDKGLSGLFHLTNSGFCSRYDWATFIAKYRDIKKFIKPVSMDLFHLPARRPKFSAMSSAKLSGELNIRIPSWEKAVESYLRES
jgi:dTDP-4-dehydrorhamnose reductase